MLDLSRELGQAIAQSANQNALLNCYTQALEKHLGVCSVCIWLFNPKTQILELQICSGCRPPSLVFPSQVPLAISLIGVIAHNQQPYITQSASQNLEFFQARDWLAQEQLTTFAGYPLIVGAEVVGVLTFFHRDCLNLALLTDLETLMPGFAAALDRCSSQAELLNGREAILFRLANHMRNSLDLDTILGIAVAEIRKILHLDRCNLLWCWTKSTTLDGTVQPSMAITHESKLENLQSLLGECSQEQVKFLSNQILSLNPLIVKDYAQIDGGDRPLADLLQTWELTALLLIPLETRSGQLGAIICGQTETPRPWQTTEIELLQAVTDQLAIAMEQANLYAQTRASALAAQTQAQELQRVLQNLQQAQTHLIQSEKMYSLGQLVAGIAHEINNPVNFIAGNLQYAKEYFDDLMNLVELYQASYPDSTPEIDTYRDTIDFDFLKEDGLRMFDSMKMGTDRIRNIVLSLRNFSRLDEAELKPVDIHEGLENTLLILQNRIKPHSQTPAIEIIKHYGDLPKVECWAGQLNQVFMNLLNNAIDALHDRPAPRQITLTTATIPSPEFALSSTDWVQIRIRDNGVGIAEEIRSHIFDPFFTTKPVGQGTGLGLSVSYKIIVDKHQGALDCDSKLGEGTEFIISIPAKLE